MNDDMNLGGF